MRDIDQQEKIVVMMARPRRSLKAVSSLLWARSKAGPVNLDDFKAEIARFVFREFGLPLHDVHIVKQFPKTTSGKVARHRCMQIYLDSR